MVLLASILAQAENGGGGSSSYSFIIIIVLFAAVFYFMLWRPQQKKMRAHMELIEGAKTGDEVVTQGGVYGFITELEDDTMLIEISEGVEIRIAKSAVSRNITATERAAKAQEEAKAKPEEEVEEEPEEETGGKALEEAAATPEGTEEGGEESKKE